MFRRSAVSALQKSAVAWNKAAPAAAATPAPKTAPKSRAGPVLTTKAGASGREGDSILDKAILVTALGAVVAWWCLVPGAHNQH